MPVTLEELFSAAQLSSGGTVNWGEAIPEAGPGVYVVSLADGYWNEGESIIYIGRTARLARRLRQFYRHRHGDPSPHKGGEAILQLSAPKRIHWAVAETHADAENRLIEAFRVKVGRMPFGNRVRSARLASGGGSAR